MLQQLNDAADDSDADNMLEQILEANEQALEHNFESEGEDSEIEDINDMIIELETPKFIFRGKDRVKREIDLNPKEGIFFRSDA